ncbi:MAG: nucleotidyltransferase domain-containing protein [Methanosarcinales archaeon]
MPKTSLKKLEEKTGRTIKEFYSLNKEKIFDVILYGSSVRGKGIPRDIDILIIFKKELRQDEYYDLPYELRKKLEKLDLNVDVKGKTLEEIFDPNFLARSSIFLEGYSLLKREFLVEELGFRGYTMFNYSLENLPQSKKIGFRYALKGRNGNGVLQTLNGKHIGSGTILIPVENTEEFKSFLERWNVNFKESRILQEV